MRRKFAVCLADTWVHACKMLTSYSTFCLQGAFNALLIPPRALGRGTRALVSAPSMFSKMWLESEQKIRSVLENEPKSVILQL